MAKQIICIRCSKQHKKASTRRQCLRQFEKYKKQAQNIEQNSEIINKQSEQPTEDLNTQIDKIYLQINEKRNSYYSFYNQYRYEGVSDKTQYTSLAEKEYLKKQKQSIKAIFQELIEVQEFASSKKRSINKQKSSIQKKQKLNRYLRENADRIQTFEDLLYNDVFNNWQWQEKKDMVSSIDLSESHARSRIREMRGKDSQSIKIKYVAAWKILTDPFARLMLSDHFLQVWHDKIFPKYVNPFKFQRLEKEFKIEQKNNESSNERFIEDEKYKDLCQKFNQLSKQLIQLKVCPIPPSLKKNAEELIKIKEDKVQQIQYEIEQIQDADESSQLFVQLPLPSQKITTYWQNQKNKAQKQRIQRRQERMKIEKAALQHKRWLKQMKNDPLTLQLKKFGVNLGFLTYYAKKNNEDLKQLLRLDHQIRLLSQKCFFKDIDIEDIDDDEELQGEISIKLLKKKRAKISKRLYPNQIKQFQRKSPKERQKQRIATSERFKKAIQRKKQRLSSMTRTIY